MLESVKRMLGGKAKDNKNKNKLFSFLIVFVPLLVAVMKSLTEKRK